MDQTTGNRNRYLAVGLGIAILLLVFCQRIWSLGPTHTDDAIWRLAAYQGNWHVITDWATSQGRVFALVSGTLLYIGAYFQGTILGSILHVGTFVVFFAGFYGLLSIYFSARVALLAAVLNLALFAMRWEGSVITTYPLFAWTLGSMFLAAVYLGWRYAQGGHSALLWLSSLLLFVSLNVHEGVSLTMAMLAALAVLANYYAGNESHSISFWRRNGRFMRQALATVGMVGLYFFSYALWRWSFPSQYNGNTLGSFNPLTVIPVLLSLSTSGSVVTDLVAPYTVNFADAISQDGYGVVYKPLRYLVSDSDNVTALVAGCIVALQVYFLTAGRSAVGGSQESDSSKIQLWCCLAVGVLIGLLPVLPVALVGKYQVHFYELKVGSYAFTPLCHFGWTLAFAALLCGFAQFGWHTFKSAALATAAGCLGLLCYCSTLKNDAIVADMRRETARWDIMEQIAEMMPLLERPIAAAHVPRLQSGSWFTVVDANYWTQFMQSRYGRSLRFENSSVSRDSLDEGLVYIDYDIARDSSQAVVFAAVLDTDFSSDEVIAREIAISNSGPDPSDNAEFVLSYQDLAQGIVVRRFSELSSLGGTVRGLRNVQAIPSSIQVSRHTVVHSLNIECGDYIRVGAPVRFGFAASGPESGDLGVKWLGGDWHPPERAGVWSSSGSAALSIPISPKEASALSLTLVASTYTGLGFYEKPQLVTVKLNGRALASREFARGDGWQAIQFDVGPSDWAASGTLELQLALEPMLNPAAQGISADARDLGICLRELSVQHRVSHSQQATVPVVNTLR